MSEWHPAHKFNLLTGSPLAFRNVIISFEKWRQEQPKTPLTLTTGWHVITPQMAEELLLRNRKNRSVHYPTVAAYAGQLVNGQWQKTGQALIFTDDEDLLDGQHRLWACYLTNTPFETFVITGVPHQEGLFAFVDASKPRTAGDALETAGLDGLSRHVAAVVNDLAHRSDQGALSITGRSRVGKLMSHEVLGYMQDHPELMEAAKYIEENYKSAKTKLGPTIATFMAWKSIEVNTGRTEPLDDFLDAMTAGDLPPGHPVRLLRTLISPDLPKLSKTEIARIKPRLKIVPLGLNMALAHAIIAYNAMQHGTLKMSKLEIDISSFPEIEPAPPQQLGFGEPEVEDAAPAVHELEPA